MSNETAKNFLSNKEIKKFCDNNKEKLAKKLKSNKAVKKLRDNRKDESGQKRRDPYLTDNEWVWFKEILAERRKNNV